MFSALHGKFHGQSQLCNTGNLVIPLCQGDSVPNIDWSILTSLIQASMLLSLNLFPNQYGCYLDIQNDVFILFFITLLSLTSSWWIFFIMWQQKRQNSHALKKTLKNDIVWNMRFKRLVLNICSLSVALNQNSKLLNLVKTAWFRLSIYVYR